MKPKKTKSGKWNVCVYVGTDATGKKRFRSVTMPTKKECIAEASKISVSQSKVIRVEEAVRRYLEAKKNVLSPNTYRGYLVVFNNYIKDDVFGFLPIDYLSDGNIQRWVSRLAEKKSPKSVKNIYGLFAAAIRFEKPGTIFSVKLPQNKQPKLHTPTTAEVEKVLEASKASRNKDLYMAVLLAAVGMMRLGEICALTADDIDRGKNTITINKATALTSDNEIVIKPPKNDSSNRTIILPRYVIDNLPGNGKIIASTPNAISMAFRKMIKRIDVVPFRFHDLRHYAASIAASSSVGASVESIKARGGWATDGMMKRVYINQLSDEVDKDTQAINTFYEKTFAKN